MYTILGIIGELATVMVSARIITVGLYNQFIKILQNGYKLNEKEWNESNLNELIEKQEKVLKASKKKNIFARIMGIIILLLPGINIIDATIKKNKLSKALFETLKNNNIVVPLEEGEEFIGLIGSKQLVIDHKLAILDNDSILPLGYTLDEVKKLNEVTNATYRLGTVEEKNVAVIGVPKERDNFARVKYGFEDYKKDFKTMSDEEAKNKTFMVYQLETNRTNEKILEKAIEEIKESRNNQKQKSIIEPKQTQPVFNENYIQTEENLFKEQSGPILKRKLY